MVCVRMHVLDSELTRPPDVVARAYHFVYHRFTYFMYGSHALCFGFKPPEVNQQQVLLFKPGSWSDLFAAEACDQRGQLGTNESVPEGSSAVLYMLRGAS